MSAIRLGVIMDPPETLHYHKDTTLAMLWEADRRGWDLYYLAPEKIFFNNGRVSAEARRLQVFRNPDQWMKAAPSETLLLSELDIILIRKDPPFDTAYLHLTRLLDSAEQDGVLVVNRPQALRDANEKLFALRFPDLCPPTLVSADKENLAAFLQEHGDVVCKPLDGMGGESVFRLRFPDQNAAVVFEMLTDYGKKIMLMQRYIPEIEQGDKRILMIDGEPVPHALARLAPVGELRANLAAGGKGRAQPLSVRDREIAAVVGPVLREMGLLFVGLDVIGDWLTEINVTSPTCVREIDEQMGSTLAAVFLDALCHRVRTKSYSDNS